MNTSRSILSLLALSILCPPAHAGIAVKEAERCSSIIAALSERHVEEAVGLMMQGATQNQNTLQIREDARIKFSAMLNYMFDVTGNPVLQRQRVEDASVPGADAIVRRELWLFPGGKGIRVGCVRYEVDDGWTTQFQFGDDMEAITTTLQQHARQKTSSRPH